MIQTCTELVNFVSSFPLARGIFCLIRPIILAKNGLKICKAKALIFVPTGPFNVLARVIQFEAVLSWKKPVQNVAQNQNIPSHGGRPKEAH